jgi:hypothetical protein
MYMYAIPDTIMLISLKHCKQWGQDNGYSYFFSVDVDEYLMPVDAGVTLMDAYHDHVTSIGKSILLVPKFNFQVNEWKCLRFHGSIHQISHTRFILVYSTHS